MKTSIRSSLLAVLVVSVFSFGPCVLAQGAYIGGSYSSTSLDIPYAEFVDLSEFLDDSSNGFKLFVGYEFTQYVAVEGEWIDLGTFDLNTDELAYYGYGPSGFEVDGYGFSVIGNIPVGKTVTLFGRVGYFFWDVALTGDSQLIDDAHAEGIPTQIDGEDPVFGAGLRVNIGKVAIQGEWETYEMGDLDADAFSLGVSFKF